MKRIGAVLVGVVAALAAVAAGSAGVRALITGAQIQNNTIESQDIRNATIRQADVSAALLEAMRGRDGAAGSAGPQGATGPQGPQGASGPPGPPGSSISYVTGYSEHVTVPPGTFRFVNAICPSGTKVVGGGYATENVSTALLVPTNSYPIGMADGRGAWYVVMHNIGSQPEAFWAVAYCVQLG